RASEISQVGRNTQGVTLIRLGEGETLQAIERLDASLDEGEAATTGATDEQPMRQAPPEA
ncbi:MAG TPA: DNA gyrase C-terminal beta-propeller domain-containing protein, partial [Luteimonas sp.]|nr:DNA gyrase C-terminal beta-propeller domain-containing protein [Luteimonas sp.]